MKKTFLLLATIVLSVFLLASCGEKQEEENPKAIQIDFVETPTCSTLDSHGIDVWEFDFKFGVGLEGEYYADKYIDVYEKGAEKPTKIELGYGSTEKSGRISVSIMDPSKVDGPDDKFHISYRVGGCTVSRKVGKSALSVDATPRWMRFNQNIIAEPGKAVDLVIISYGSHGSSNLRKLIDLNEKTAVFRVRFYKPEKPDTE